MAEETNGTIRRRELTEAIDRSEQRQKVENAEIRQQIGEIKKAQRSAEERSGDQKRDNAKLIITCVLATVVPIATLVWFAIRAGNAPIVERQDAARLEREKIERAHKGDLVSLEARLSPKVAAAHELSVRLEERVAAAKEEAQWWKDFHARDLRNDPSADLSKGAIGAELRAITERIESIQGKMDRLEGDLAAENRKLQGYLIGKQEGQ